MTRSLALLAVLVVPALTGCFPFGGGEGCTGDDCSSSSSTTSPPECTADADCSGKDTDHDACKVARCEYGSCEIVDMTGTKECQCLGDSDCQHSTCSTAACDKHQCVETILKAGPAPDQTAGDCAEVMCDGTSRDAKIVASAKDVPTQTKGDCVTLYCDGTTPMPQSMADPTDVPDDGNECTVDSCDVFGPSFTPVADGTSCSGGGFCFEGTCMKCVPQDPASCGSEGPDEPANNHGSTPMQFTAPACGFLDGSDIDWYTFYADDQDFVDNILNFEAWSTAATIEVCAYVTCSDGTLAGGGCPSPLPGPNGSQGCCWTGASAGFEASWDLDCGTNEDSGTVYVSVRAPGGGACETYAVDMSY